MMTRMSVCAGARVYAFGCERARVLAGCLCRPACVSVVYAQCLVAPVWKDGQARGRGLGTGSRNPVVAKKWHKGENQGVKGGGIR